MNSAVVVHAWCNTYNNTYPVTSMNMVRLTVTNMAKGSVLSRYTSGPRGSGVAAIRVFKARPEECVTITCNMILQCAMQSTRSRQPTGT